MPASWWGPTSRPRFVKELVTQTVSDTLCYVSPSWDYSAGLMRGKIRNLKRSFQEAKCSQHLAKYWPQYKYSGMQNIFDTLLSGELTGTAGLGLVRNSTKKKGKQKN